MKILLGVAAVILIVLWIRIDAKRRAAKIDSVFAGRPRLTPEQFYDRYFKAQGIPFGTVDGVRSVLEEQLGADLSRLLDTDDFSENLSFFWQYDSMVDVEIVCALEEKFAIQIPDEQAANVRTFNDLVHLVHTLTLARPES